MMDGLRARIAPCVGALALSACLSDFKPEVGPLIKMDDNQAQAGADAGKGKPAMHGDDDGSDMPSHTGDGDDPGHHMLSDGGDDPQKGDSGSSPDAGMDVMPDAGHTPVDCVIGDSNPNKEVSFANDVMPILAVCRCHNPSSDDTQGIMMAGLTITGYDTLRAGGIHTGTDIVVPFNACKSIVLQKLSEAPPFGDQMPLDGPYLLTAERKIISDWIVEGARDN
jgi:hypothetical protein